jgi:hypothetical protein
MPNINKNNNNVIYLSDDDKFYKIDTVETSCSTEENKY